MPTHASRWRLTALLVAVALLFILWLLRDGGRKSTSDSPGGASRGAAASGDPRGNAALLPADDEVDDADKLTLEGRVIWPDGKPAEDAAIRILSRPGAARGRFAPDRETISDAQGEFAFDLQVPGEYIVQAQKDETVSPAVRARLIAGSGPVTLMLLPGASLTVTVVSAADGRPIPDAVVRVQLANDQVMQGDGFREGHTDPQGKARFAGIDPVGNHPVWAEANGFAGKQINVMPMERVGTSWEARIALSPGAIVSGRVLDARGHGIPGALVGWAFTEEHIGEEAFRVFSPFADLGRMSEQVTDAEGRYRLSVEGHVGCVVAEHPRLRVGTTCGVSVRVGQETTGIDVVLLDGVNVSGRVVDASGKAVEGAEVIATTPDNIHEPSARRSYRYRTRSGKDGQFTLAGLPPLPGTLAATTDDAASPLHDVDLAGPPRTPVILKLEYTGRIDGVVTEADGRPVPFAAVNYFYQPDFVALERQHGGRVPKLIREYALPTNNEATVTDGEGRFHIGALAPGRYAVRATRPTSTAVPPAYGSVYKYEVPTGSTIQLVMPGLGSIRGRVRAEDGSAMRSFRISLYLADGRVPADYMFPGAHTFVSQDGSFLLEGVPANTYVMRLDGDEVVAQRMDVEVRGSAVTDLGTITVVKGQPARAGQVVTDRREGVAHATVTVVLPDSPSKLVLFTEDDGSFRVPSVPMGKSVGLRSDHPAGSSGWVAMAPTDQTVTLVLVASGNGVVRGVLVGSDVTGQAVILAHHGDKPPGTGESEVRGVTETLAGGSFVFENVAPGEYVVWVPLGGDDFARTPDTIEVEKGRDVNVIFDLATAPRVKR